ncbi:hypothetical protein RUM44_002505 [Polyplax serrata]|uniref:DRBM domain-containing protein n=1 Tax=Polyplax serrata TaxID=468196 RepID=A0ABR1AGB3_POLSC
MFGRSGCVSGVILPIPAQQQMQIMTQNHYTNQNSYSPQGQGNVSSYVAAQQVPPQKSNYHQAAYSQNNLQIIMGKQTVSRNKNYRKEYNVMKDANNYNMNERNSQSNTFFSNEYNSNHTFRYHHGHNNGYYQPPIQKESLHKTNHEISSSVKEKPVEKEVTLKIEENNQMCPAISSSAAPGTKEKTPMCLVNELARFNKITHQYRLTNEQGPAHKKSFTVTLTLGSEEYTAEGPSIKKAQHSAAAEALSKTMFSHPTPKAVKNLHSGKSTITPTVELNALAMKRGEPAVYKLLEPNQGQQIFEPQPSFGFRRSYFGRGGRLPVKSTYYQNMQFTVSLKVGSWEFFGEGISPQSARHDAASKALSQLKLLPIPQESGVCPAPKEKSFNSTQNFDSSVKSPISSVYEIALKRNMNVAFEVVSDRGPPHMKIFVTKCTVGTITATGEGSGKKISKKRAADNMLIELKKLPPVSPEFAAGTTNQSKSKKKFGETKKKSKNIIKVVQDNKESGGGDDINPMSRLIQIQQLKKEKKPVYTLLEERGTPKKREFVMQVTVGQFKATGSGSNKKLAKKAAAQNVLMQMGFGKPDGSEKSFAAITQDGDQRDENDKKVSFVETEKTENNTGGSSGRQLKPGIYVMSTCDQQCSQGNNLATPINMQTTATIAKELLKGGISPTAEALQKSTGKQQQLTTSYFYRPKDQLLYLADLLNFQVHFSDFPKGNHSEFLSLVTMSTDPSHVCHGSGSTVEESQDLAALTALTALSEMGLDSVTMTTPNSTKE